MIQTGVEWFGVANTPQWNLHTGNGERIYRSADIKFNPPFTAPPHVVLSVGGIDVENGVRLTLIPYEDIEAGEFNIRIGTWGDTKLHQLWVTWIAHD